MKLAEIKQRDHGIKQKLCSNKSADIRKDVMSPRPDIRLVLSSLPQHEMRSSLWSYSFVDSNLVVISIFIYRIPPGYWRVRDDLSPGQPLSHVVRLSVNTIDMRWPIKDNIWMKDEVDWRKSFFPITFSYDSFISKNGYGCSKMSGWDCTDLYLTLYG